MTIFLISVLVALLISALCSLLEATVLSLTPSQVAELAQRRPRLGALWREFKDHIERPIAVILILNTAAHTIGATIAGAKFEEQYGAAGLVWFSLLFTYLMLQFTEILPKTLGVRYNQRLAAVVAYPLAWLIRVLTPVVYLIHLVNRPFERRREGETRDTTLEEITALAGLARLANLIGPHQERIIRGASRLSDLRARDLMIPAAEVTFLSTAQSLMDAIVAAHQDPHTRFPIVKGGDSSEVLGYVNFKEMIYRLKTNPNDSSPEGIIRPVRFVGPDEPAAQLLRAFVDQHEHMAIVRDADGKTLGLITLEDLIEELVGELEDEFDRLPRMLHPLSHGTWMVGGGVPIKEVAARLGLELPDGHGTTSAWLIRRMGRVPRVGEAYREGGAEFLVRRTRRGKAFEAMVTRLTPPASHG
jgi:CBS domain containing-hemolysin-like protein